MSACARSRRRRSTSFRGMTRWSCAATRPRRRPSRGWWRASTDARVDHGTGQRVGWPRPVHPPWRRRIMRPFVKGLAAAAALAVCGAAYAQQPTTLKMQATWPASLKLNIYWLPILPSGPQAFGWFKRPIKNLADFKGMKCRQTGMAAEVFQRMGMTTVNMPGGEIIPSAQRGVIDCAEWVGGVEDMRLGFQNVWKYHYTPGMHENVTIGEVVFNMDVWKGLSATHQEIIKSAANETFLVWWAKWQKQNAEAVKELQEKHGVHVLRTPPDILVEFLKTWDTIAAEESKKNPFFKKVLDSQRAYASLVVPAKRFMFPPYSFAANYYWPEGGATKGGATKADMKKK